MFPNPIMAASGSVLTYDCLDTSRTRNCSSGCQPKASRGYTEHANELVRQSVIKTPISAYNRNWFSWAQQLPQGTERRSWLGSQFKRAYKMNRRLTLILLAAFGIAAICTFAVYQMVRSRISAKTPTSTNVVAAKTDIKLGTILKPEDLTTIAIAGTPPLGAILDKDKSRAIGRGVISDLYKDEPIMENRLAAVGAGGGLAAAIPQGMRACAVKVDEVVGVSGFATPGMRVDVVMSGTPPGDTSADQGAQVRTVLQNIQVLSAGTEFQQVKDAEGKAKQVQVVNLLVTPEQAQTLELASSQVIRLVLRNPLDTKTDPVIGSATINLFAGPNAVPEKPKPVVAAKKSAPKPPPPYSIEVINGSKTSQEKFASPEGHQ